MSEKNQNFDLIKQKNSTNVNRKFPIATYGVHRSKAANAAPLTTWTSPTKQQAKNQESQKEEWKRRRRKRRVRAIVPHQEDYHSTSKEKTKVVVEFIQWVVDPTCQCTCLVLSVHRSFSLRLTLDSVAGRPQTTCHSHRSPFAKDSVRPGAY